MGFCLLQKNIGKNLSNKYGHKLLNSAKKSNSAIDAIKTDSKKAIQKTAEATGDLIDNKIADKITSVSKKPLTKLLSVKLQNDETELLTQRYISPEERQQIIDELRLLPKKDVYF